MRQLLKKGTKWEWTEERNTDLKKLKKELTTQPCLAHYNGNKDNIVTTDASNTGLGIALWQRQNVLDSIYTESKFNSFQTTKL